MITIDIGVRLGSFRLDAGFEAPSNGVTALFGRSGSGKTTIVKSIAGLVKPDRGRIAVHERVLFDQEAGINMPTARRNLGYVFQEGRLFPHMSVRRNLLYGRRDCGGQGPGLEETVALLGLADLLDRLPSSLSGGERQRVAIGRALLAAPRLLLMDEPLASLDAERRAEILPYLAGLRRLRDIPIIYVSHQLDEILSLADWLVLVSDGEVTASGPVEQVASEWRLSPGLDRDETVILACRVRDHDSDYHLTRLTWSGGDLWVAGIDAEPGRDVRLGIRPRDITISLLAPEQTSALNVFPARITGFEPAGRAEIDVLLSAGDAVLRARVTRRSVSALGLVADMRVHALIKASGIDVTVRVRHAG